MLEEKVDKLNKNIHRMFMESKLSSFDSIILGVMFFTVSLYVNIVFNLGALQRILPHENYILIVFMSLPIVTTLFMSIAYIVSIFKKGDERFMSRINALTYVSFHFIVTFLFWGLSLIYTKLDIIASNLFFVLMILLLFLGGIISWNFRLDLIKLFREEYGLNSI